MCKQRVQQSGCLKLTGYLFLACLLLSVIGTILANPGILFVLLCLAGVVAIPVLLFYVDRQREKVEREDEARQRLLAQQDLQLLSPGEFEEYVAQIFRSHGWTIGATGGKAGGGFDFEIEKDGIRAIVQCKRYAPDNRVGVKDIREFDAVVHRSGAQRGYLVTTSSYTRQALDWDKQAPNVILVDGNQLAGWVAQARTQGAQHGPQPDRLTRDYLFVRQKIIELWGKPTGKLTVIGGGILLSSFALCMFVSGIVSAATALSPTATRTPSPAPTVTMIPTETATNTIAPATSSPTPQPPTDTPTATMTTVPRGGLVATSLPSITAGPTQWPATAAPTDLPAPTSVPTQPPTPIPPTATANPWEGCPKYTCGAFGSCGAVHAYLAACPQYWGDLDGDSDGIPCEVVCQ